jgi:hypothetical protein
MGKGSAAGVASSLQVSYKVIKLALGLVSVEVHFPQIARNTRNISR